MSNHSVLLSSSIAAVVVIIDQLSKVFAQQAGQVLFNPGLSFGLLSDSVHLKISIFVGGMVLLFFLGYRLWRDFPIASGLFWGGALSNTIDRVMYGAVRDWLPTPVFSVTNNFADWSIALGSILVVWSIMRASKESHVSS